MNQNSDLGALIANPVKANGRLALIVVAFTALAAFNTAIAQIAALSITGPAVIEPGQNVSFTYKLTGQNSVSSTEPVVVFLSRSTTAPTGAMSERVGGFSAPLAFQAIIDFLPRYKAQASALPTPSNPSLAIPEELSDSSWPLADRGKGTIPPGNYHIVLWVRNTHASYPVVVEPMAITAFTPTSQAIGQRVEITGAHLDRATRVYMSGAEIFAPDWSYSSVSKRITAKIPSGATNSGKIEVRNPAQTASSTANLNLLLPDITLPVNPDWSARHVLSHAEGATTSGSIKTGRPSFLRVQLKNSGTLAARDLTSAELYVDGALSAVRYASASLAIAGSEVLDIPVPKLSAGSHSLRVVADSSASFNRELSETNNSLDISVAVSPHPVDAWRALHFAASDLGNPLREGVVYGDAADPDGDGMPNLQEFMAGSSPTASGPLDSEVRPHLSASGTPTRLSLTFRRAASAGGITVLPEVASDLASGQWATAAAGIDYTMSVTPDGTGENVSFHFGGDPSPGFIARLRIDRAY